MAETAHVEAAVESLVRWVRLIFESGSEPRPPVLAFLPRYRGPSSKPLFDLSDDYWSDFVRHEALLGWLNAALQDPRILRAYVEEGESRKAAEQPLRREAERFANDMLRHSPTFDEPYVRNEAMALWRDIAAEKETYEVGGVAESVRVDGQIGTVTIGPGMTLRPVIPVVC